MIELPQRSVTRFFVPLIDVLILLFCIFLLLPFVSSPADPNATPDQPTDLESARAKLKQTEEELAKERKYAEELRKERGKSAERTTVCVIEIDGDTGELTATDPNGGTRAYTIDSADTARQFVLRTKLKADGRAVKYLFLRSRKKTARFPDAKTLANIGDWFAGEAVDPDNPFTLK